MVSAFREAKRLEHERAREGWTVGFGKTMAKVLHRRGLCVEVPPRALAAAAHIMLDRAGETAAERKREGWQGDLGYVLGAKLDQALAELGYARAPAERWGR